jgi:hypothetical protein
MKARAAESICGACVGLCVALACVTSVATAQPAQCPAPKQWPSTLRIEYDVTASRGPFSINGESVVTFERKDNAYSITAETDSAAIYHARQTSRGIVEPAGLRPDEYVEARGRRTPITTTYDWAAKQVRFSVAPDVVAEALPGLQDRATMPLQLSWLQRAAPAVTEFDVPLTGSRSVGVARFVRQNVEKVTVSFGTVEGVHFERVSDHENDRIEAWFSAAWCGLPVRVRYTDKNGGVIDHRMRGARIE